MGTASEVSELYRRYVTLLKHAVTHTLYQPPDPARLADEDTERAPTDVSDRPRFAQTMVGLRRLDNVQECVEEVLATDVRGDLIETGVWRGGVAIFMRGLLAAHGVRDRIVFAADSFEGLPEPNPEEYPADDGDELHTIDALAVSRAEVERNFDLYGLLDDQVRFLEGWFRDTLPVVRERSWAVVRLDGDMYESTTDALVNLYPGLSVGGFLIIDDYAHTPCRQAVEDYRTAHGIDEPIKRIDFTGAFWQRRT